MRAVTVGYNMKVVVEETEALELMSKLTKLVYDTTYEIWEVNCPMGLWGVSCCDLDRVLSEAYSYFSLYLEDGEYDHLVIRT